MDWLWVVGGHQTFSQPRPTYQGPSDHTYPRVISINVHVYPVLWMSVTDKPFGCFGSKITHHHDVLLVGLTLVSLKAHQEELKVHKYTHPYAHDPWSTSSFDLHDESNRVHIMFGMLRSRRCHGRSMFYIRIQNILAPRTNLLIWNPFLHFEIVVPRRVDPPRRFDGPFLNWEGVDTAISTLVIAKGHHTPNPASSHDYNLLFVS